MAIISLKRYLDSDPSQTPDADAPDGLGLVAALTAAYRRALSDMGLCSIDACAASGEDLQNSLSQLDGQIQSHAWTAPLIEQTAQRVNETLKDWGLQTARHYQQKTDEVKEMLLVMAGAAESVGERDQRCATQMNEITERLQQVASLDDLTQIRTCVRQGASELRDSITRMEAEGKQAIDKLRSEVSSYQAKLEKAEENASRDPLTGLQNRLFLERLIERGIQSASSFCVAMVDIDHFKQVNDHHGHLAGDRLLKQFATELRSASRSTDVIGRWGGDEFILLLNGLRSEAEAQIERLTKWVCGSYSLDAEGGSLKLEVQASIGLAESTPGDTLQSLLQRADTAMYQHKSHARTARKARK